MTQKGDNLSLIIVTGCHLVKNSSSVYKCLTFLRSAQRMHRPAEPLLSLFNILRNRDLLVIDMGTDSFLCLCHMAAADSS